GWSWPTMLGAHWQSGVAEIQAYRFTAVGYAHSWLIVALAISALGRRWIEGGLAPLLPWVVAALSALLIHLLHRPFFEYYDLHLLTPVAALAALGVVDLWGWLRAGTRLWPWERRAVATVVLAACVGWGWQRIAQIADRRRLDSPVVASSTVVRELQALREAGHGAFAMNPLWTFSATMLQTPPELTILSLKRGWCGAMTSDRAAELVESNHVAGIVVSPRMQRTPAWSNLLSGFVATARAGEDVLYVRKDLNPKPLDLEEENVAVLRRLLREHNAAFLGQPGLKP
ncbi:MAG: hypothetical protein ACYC23_20515, partial [Limisphaerales bacterium]